VSPDLAGRIRAERRLLPRLNDVKGWGYYPWPAEHGASSDPEVRFRSLLDSAFGFAKFLIVRGDLARAEHVARGLVGLLIEERDRRRAALRSKGALVAAAIQLNGWNHGDSGPEPFRPQPEGGA
jgi:hypothetical protein